MKWSLWKKSLLVAMLTGLFTALSGIAAGITWRQFGIILAVCVGKDALLFLKDHPVEDITDTTLLKKDDSTPTVIIEAFRKAKEDDSLEASMRSKVAAQLAADAAAKNKP